MKVKGISEFGMVNVAFNNTYCFTTLIGSLLNDFPVTETFDLMIQLYRNCLFREVVTAKNVQLVLEQKIILYHE